jgi:hypothetical protein
VAVALLLVCQAVVAGAQALTQQMAQAVAVAVLVALLGK